MLAVPVAAIFAPFYAEQHQFGHANIALPAWLDRTLRLLIVTPDMHRVHHSVRFREHDSNYGFNLSIWDRTYTAQARGWPRGHDHLSCRGLNAAREHCPMHCPIPCCRHAP